MFKRVASFLLLSSMLLLTACGGGGDTSGAADKSSSSDSSDKSMTVTDSSTDGSAASSTQVDEPSSSTKVDEPTESDDPVTVVSTDADELLWFNATAPTVFDYDSKTESQGRLYYEGTIEHVKNSVSELYAIPESTDADTANAYFKKLSAAIGKALGLEYSYTFDADLTVSRSTFEDNKVIHEWSIRRFEDMPPVLQFTYNQKKDCASIDFEEISKMAEAATGVRVPAEDWEHLYTIAADNCEDAGYRSVFVFNEDQTDKVNMYVTKYQGAVDFVTARIETTIG